MKTTRSWLSTVAVLLVLPAASLISQTHKTGAVFSAAAYEQVPRNSTLVRALYQLPSHASVKQYAPEAGDQGQFGTCTAWASAYSAVTIIYAKLNGITSKKEITASAFSPGFAFLDSFAGGFFGCGNGQVTAYVLRAIQKDGVPFFSELDSLCPSMIPSQAFERARSYSILGFTRIASPRDGKAIALEKVKKTISETKPVVVGMNVDDVPGKGAYSTLSSQGVWQPDRGVAPTAGHAMTIVSYDDAYAGGAFELQNSWGRSWGKDGFFWIRYDDFFDYFQEAFELIENQAMVSPDGSELSGALALERTNGQRPAVSWDGTTYSVQEDFPSGTRFRIYLDNNEPAFVYMVTAAVAALP